ncbi:DNA photolyase DNA photolyase [Euphorbia peplus]|nr:DNA photolyase DNA photolyase [Euphorbia peplus]
MAVFISSALISSCVVPLRSTCFCSLSPYSSKSASATSIVWFKQDLRLHDHPGLLQASSYPSLLPLYVFDHHILSRYSEETLEIVLLALADLRKSLKGQGSNLMIRVGGVENVIRDLLEEVEAAELFAEEEVEYHLRTTMKIVEEALTNSTLSYRNPKIIRWRTPFFDIKNLKDLPASYVDFKKLPVTSPLLPPTLPRTPMELNWGSMPTLDELKKFMNENPFKVKESWTSIKEMSPETILQNKKSKLRGANSSNWNFKQRQRSKVENSVFVTQKQTVLGGGTSNILNALAGYFRYLEGTARDDWQEVHERLRNAESREGASFFALFGPSLCLGIISRRKVYYEAIKYEKERNAGFLSPFGYSATTVAAAVDAVSSMEWYWLMALKGQVNNDGTYSTRIWRWNGYLIQYTVVGKKGPPILLVHGFGAFLEHYRDNINPISEGGNRIWAVTVLGFGKSEKPNVVYTELMWAELLRDFVVDIVGEPVHLVGNSIGGYFISILAYFWPALVKSVVLINTAGDVIPGYGDHLNITKERQTSFLARLGAKLLLPYLRLNIRNIVKQCYPANPERADDWLINEMLRASEDPGVNVVLESIFSFNLSLPLNYLLEAFEGKVIVIQGMKDPISDSKSKVAMLKEHCCGVVIRELDAGHCPHDERPEEVNAIICEWVAAAEAKISAVTFA